MKPTTRVLLIEDDELISRAYQLGLEKEGIQIDVASDGVQGMHALEQGGYALVLLDLILPKIDGFELFAKARKAFGNALPPVIILSNLGQETDVARGRSMGAVDYLIKANTTMEEVAQKIRAYL